LISVQICLYSIPCNLKLIGVIDFKILICIFQLNLLAYKYFDCCFKLLLLEIAETVGVCLLLINQWSQRMKTGLPQKKLKNRFHCYFKFCYFFVSECSTKFKKNELHLLHTAATFSSLTEGSLHNISKFTHVPHILTTRTGKEHMHIVLFRTKTHNTVDKAINSFFSKSQMRWNTSSTNLPNKISREW
jgi:hypothetical protein